jgi:hypothetical protein
MRHLFVPLAVCLFSFSATAAIIDERLRDDFDRTVAVNQHDLETGPAATRDEEKFDEAAERRKKRRDEALERRRIQNANKSHVYKLTSVFRVPSPWGAFDLQRDINRGMIIDAGTPGTLGGWSLGGVNANVKQLPAMKVLFLQDENGISPNKQPNFLAQNGISVLTPNLPLDDVAESIRIAEWVASSYRPDVIVGHSRGGAVAMNMKSGNTPVLLMSPAWKNWGEVVSVKQKAVIMHSPRDATVPFAASEQLRENSALPPQSLIAVGTDHSLSDPTSLSVMLRACLALALN